MNGGDYGEDEDSSIKLLTKHKAMKLEIDTYSVIVQEISATFSKWEMFSTLKDNRELKDLKNRAKVRRGCLVVAL